MKRSAYAAAVLSLITFPACTDAAGPTPTGASTSMASSSTTTSTAGASTTTPQVTTTTQIEQPGGEVAPSTSASPGPTATVMTHTLSGVPCVDDTVVASAHTIDASVDPVTAAFELQIGGWTGDDATGLVRSIELEGGLLTVDFEDLRVILENASTTDASCALLAEMSATAFQFVDVERVTFQIEGSCEAFFGWLQRDPCVVYERG